MTLSKEQRIANLLSEIKAKLERIQKENDNLTAFNFKIRGLNKAFREYQSVGGDEEGNCRSDCVSRGVSGGVSDGAGYDSDVNDHGIPNDRGNKTSTDYKNDSVDYRNDSDNNTADISIDSSLASIKQPEFTLQSILTKSSRLFPHDSKTQQHLKKIIQALYDTSEKRERECKNDSDCHSHGDGACSLGFKEILHSGVSKYRVVEILGRLSENGVVGKKYDNEFYYYLKKD